MTRRRGTASFQEEMEAHLRMAIRDRMERGQSQEEARPRRWRSSGTRSW
jgi:hypothetical protein